MITSVLTLLLNSLFVLPSGTTDNAATDQHRQTRHLLYRSEDTKVRRNFFLCRRILLLCRCIFSVYMYIYVCAVSVATAAATIFYSVHPSSYCTTRSSQLAIVACRCTRNKTVNGSSSVSSKSVSPTIPQALTPSRSSKKFCNNRIGEGEGES